MIEAKAGGAMRRQEVDARTRADELANIYDFAPIGLCVLDTELRYVRINARMAEINGVRAEDHIGRTVQEIVPDLTDQVLAAMRRVLAGEEIWGLEISGFTRARPGVIRTWRENWLPLRDEAGEIVGVTISAEELTEERAAHRALRDSEVRLAEHRKLLESEAARREADALYRAYFDNTPEALFIVGVTPDGGYVVEETNAAHEAGVGLRLSDIQGKRIEDILPPEAARKVIRTYDHVVSTCQPYQFREVYELDGLNSHWDTTLVPMKEPSGAVVRLIGSSRDVTPQVLAEEALRQSQKMESMGQLTGGVAHDFNNLLTPIVGALDMLQRATTIGQRERRLIDGAMQSADRAKTLVQRLLAFARRQPLQPVPVDVSDVVRSMGELVASITGPQIKVTVEADETPAACADQNQLEMAVLNLAVNARDAMPEGGTLRLSVQEVVADGSVQALVPGHYVRVSVADTGVGMDPATVARAVEPFFSTKGVGQGTGLGLSMAHGLAQQLGGALLIHSTPGVGTNVELYLPRSEASTEADAGDDPPNLPVTGRGAVLVVDDEDLVRASTADMLSEAGFEVSVAASAEDALRAMRGGHAPDFVVTDHLMPGMSGHDLARTVRTEFPWTRVLVVSGYAQHEGLTSDVALLSKPFRSADLLSALAALGA